jgi:phosphoribosylcarboxyaminoimidazole (NCAIR) mutase
VVLEPKNAALLAAKMLSLSEPGLREKIGKVQEEQRQRLLDADAEIRARTDVSTG